MTKAAIAAGALALFLAQAGSGIIDGSVSDDAGSPLPGASVTLLTSAGRPLKTLDADDHGGFVFDGLGDGAYSVRASMPGYITRAFGQTTPSAPGINIAIADSARYRARVRLARVGTISGTIADEHGLPIAAAVRAVRLAIVGGVRTQVDRVVSVEADRLGRYRLADLPPGEYLISALGPDGEFRQMTPSMLQQATLAVQQPGQPLPPFGTDGPLSYAPVYYPGVLSRDRAAVVSLAPGEDRANVSVQLQVVPVTRTESTVAGVAVARVLGRVVFEGSTPPPDCRRTSCRPQLVPRNVTTGDRAATSSIGVMDSSGPVVFSGLAAGSYILSLASPIAGWTLASATLNGRDVADLPFDVQGQDLTGLVATFTDRPTELKGTVPTASPAPFIERVTVVVFPADRQLWLPGARRVRVLRPDSTGRYVVTGLPAGEYLVAVVTDFDFESELDAARISALERTAARVTLGASQP